MFCPECHAEYVAGVSLCPDCRVPLEAELPPEPVTEFVEHVTVLATGNPVVLALAKSVLESAGIRCFVRGEILQDLFRIGTAEIRVPEEEAERATDLLRERNFGEAGE
ncbi:MAG TPA: hypothetical protein DD658_09580 [Deltaproteobacteria bacterium]|nr:MAG: hypothetical protein A2X88_01235 [Deltaproteobacteria bacterium GWC2_65_14]HBO70345.1 hypothetical protein [Deltaproteobacteria bacterium]